MLILVYVGAVMVLFLFVVMMLDIDIEKLRQGFTRYAPLGALIALIVVGADRRRGLGAQARAAGRSRRRRMASPQPRAIQQHRGTRAPAVHATTCIRSSSRPCSCWSPSSRPSR